MDARELIAALTGGFVHGYVLDNKDSPNPEKVDSFLIGFAGGALGGMIMTNYMADLGSISAVAAGVVGMLAFDYFLYGM